MNLTLTKNELVLENGIKIEAEHVSYSIYKTKDYDKFNSIKANRVLNKPHVNAIKKSIKESNLLYTNPILINQWGQVIDGQHRLMAAKELGLDIYFLIMPNLGAHDIAILNSYQKNWSFQDYILSHYNDTSKDYETKKAYEYVLSLSKENNLTIPVVLALLHGASGGKDKTLFDIKTGNYTETTNKNKEICNDCIEIIHFLTKLSVPEVIVKSSKFAMGLRAFFCRYDINLNVFKTKLEYQSRKIVKCTGVGYYTELLLEIYNFKNSNPAKLRSN